MRSCSVIRAILILTIGMTLSSKQLFLETGIISFKNLFGETPSASAFATWFAANLVSGKSVPQLALQKPVSGELKTILIYNHYQGNQHGFVLVRAVD